MAQYPLTQNNDWYEVSILLVVSCNVLMFFLIFVQVEDHQYWGAPATHQMVHIGDTKIPNTTGPKQT